VVFCCCFQGARVWTQASKQVLYCLSHTSNLFCYGYFIYFFSLFIYSYVHTLFGPFLPSDPHPLPCCGYFKDGGFMKHLSELALKCDPNWSQPRKSLGLQVWATAFFFQCGHPVVPAPLLKRPSFFHCICLLFFVKHSLAICIWIFLCALYSVPLIFFFFCGFNSGPIPWATMPSLFLWWVFQDRVSRTICLVSFEPLSSWGARITGVSHQCLAHWSVFKKKLEIIVYNRNR
jgi:hypothetical protein